MRRVFLIVMFICMLAGIALGQSSVPIKIREVDGSPSKVNPTEFVLPNGTISVSGGRVTYTPAASGSVTSVSVVTANGLSGSVANSTTTPALTLNISGLDAAKIADGTVSSAEFQFINSLTSDAQTQFNAKAPLASPTFTGTVIIPTPFTLGAVSVLPTGTELNFVDGVTSSIQTQLDGKQASLGFTAENAANKDAASGYAGLTAGSLLKTAEFPAFTGDFTTTSGGVVSVLATVNANVGSFTYGSFTVNAKGLITAASSGAAPEVPLTFSTGLTRSTNTVTVNTSQNIATLSNLTSNGLVTTSGSAGTLGVTAPGTGVLTALGVNVGSAGAFVVNGGALGTPSSGVATNLTGTASGLTAGNVTTNANLTGDVTSVGNATAIATGVIVNADINGSAAIDATKIADGTVTSSEFQFINTLSSNAQTQIDTKAPLASPTFTTPTLGAATATSIAFSPTTGGIIGTTTNDVAGAGKVGEYQSSVVNSGSAVSLTTTVTANLTSESLTAGDWDVWAEAVMSPGGTTTVSLATISVSQASATHSFATGDFFQAAPGGTTPGVSFSITAGPVRVSLSGTTTVFAVASSTFGTSTMAVYGILRARRIR
jgi:hypothetical protein